MDIQKFRSHRVVSKMLDHKQYNDHKKKITICYEFNETFSLNHEIISYL